MGNVDVGKNKNLKQQLRNVDVGKNKNVKQQLRNVDAGKNKNVKQQLRNVSVGNFSSTKLMKLFDLGQKFSAYHLKLHHSTHYREKDWNTGTPKNRNGT